MAAKRPRRLVLGSNGISDEGNYVVVWDGFLAKLDRVGSWTATHRERRRLVPAYVDMEPDCWSFREKSFLGWLRFASWGICPQCQVRYPRTLEQSELLNLESAVRHLDKKCWQCRQGKFQYKMPEATDFPAALRELTLTQALQLRPLVLHQGSPHWHPNGYPRKDQLSAISWASVSVLTSIQDCNYYRAVTSGSPVFFKDSTS